MLHFIFDSQGADFINQVYPLLHKQNLQRNLIEPISSGNPQGTQSFMYSRVSFTIEIETLGLTQAFTAEVLSTCSQMVNYFDHFYVVSASCAVSKYALVQAAGKSEFESKTICNCEKK